MVGRIFQEQIPPVGRNDNFGGVLCFAEAEVVGGGVPQRLKPRLIFALTRG